MYRNRAEATSSFQIVPAGESPNSAAEAGDTAPRPPLAEAPLQPVPVKAAPTAMQARRAPRKRSRRLVLSTVALLAIGVAGYFGYEYWTVGRFTVSTDDAYVQAYNTTLAAKVSGYLASVPVTDNMQVHAGDVIATIDDGDYRLAVDSAREKVATQQATIARMGHQIEAQEAAVTQAKTQLVSAQAAQTRTQLELDRQIALVARDASSRQLLEQAQANRDQAVAGVQGAQAAIDSAAANVDVLKGQQQEAISTLNELKTALAKAERDLSFTVIRAPIDGVIGNRAVQTGDFVQTGQRVASLVPLDDVYVDANFKETQLARLRPGQTVSIAVDALPEHSIEGTVESFSPASGAVFSCCRRTTPPATSPRSCSDCRCASTCRPTSPARGCCDPGMSVVVSVNTKANKADASQTHSAAR